MARKGKGDAKRIRLELIGAVEDTVGKLQLRAWQVLAIATPVATGFARSGWTPSVGSPVVDRLDRPTSEKEARKSARAMYTANLATAKKIAATYRVGQGSAFLSQNVIYVQFLNKGSSSQAPAGFIERGIEVTVKSFGGRRL